MWSLLLLCFTSIQPVVLQENNRLILQDGSNPCEGYIKVYYKGQWGLVGYNNSGEKAEKVVCGSIDCGSRIKSEDMWRPSDSVIGLNELNCTGDEKDLWSCSHPGWKISQGQPETVKKITCSHNITISLDRFECSGSVQYSTDGKTPSGYFCGDTWGDSEKRVACSTLGCGEPAEDQLYPPMHSYKKTMKVAKCVGDVKHLWQCVTEEASCQKPAAVTCTGHEIMRLQGHSSNACSGRLQIKIKDAWGYYMKKANSTENMTELADGWCQKMFCGNSGSLQEQPEGINLTCSDKVSIALKDNDKISKCYGSVHIQKNNEFHPVCASQQNWPQKNAEVVCKELDCGTVISTERKSATSKGIMDSVDCKGDEDSLWHCNAKRDNKTSFSSPVPFVICSGSVKVRLADGPGRCAGRVEIYYEGEWRQVMSQKDTSWADNNAQTVCKELGCGGVQSLTEKFSKAKKINVMPKTVVCTQVADSIAKCIVQASYSSSVNDVEVGLICEEHKVFYLGGNSCSGKVKVQHGNREYWLSGSTKTWNKAYADMVCEKMHCGNVANFSTANLKKNSSIWQPDLSCPNKSNPLLDCGKKASSNRLNTVATVKCSGNKTITLTDTCRGKVNICVEGGCGGVCAESWTKDKSEKLCHKLGCGSRVLETKPVKDSGVMFKSVHIPEKDNNLTMCTFVKNDGSSCDAAYVVCSGSLKPQFKSNDYCSGRVELEYDEVWRPVCGNALQNAGTQGLICQKLDCGDGVKSFDYKTSDDKAISKMECGNPTQHPNLIECTASVGESSCTSHGLQCSKSKKMVLAAGVACSGYVVVYSEGKMRVVSSEGWSETESHKLCKDLDCGVFSKVDPNKSIAGSEFWNTTFNCTGVDNDKNIWACEKQVPPREKKPVYIKCTDEPIVKLEKRCHGNITIKGIEVCDTSWDDKYSSMVCQELGYSNAIRGNLDNSAPESGKQYFHVHCEEHHHKIGQCKRVRGRCSGRLVSVYCTKNAKFDTTEKCGGQLEVIYEEENGGKVCYDTKLSPKYEESVCQQLGDCGGRRDKPKDTKTAPRDEIDQWTTVLKCTGEQTDLRYCLTRESCSGKTAAEVYCQKYVPRPPPPPPPTPVNVVAVVLGVGLFLVVVIIIFVIVRVYIIRKNRGIKNFLPGFPLRNDVEFDSGEFEEIPSKDMDNVARGGPGVRSESEVVTENDARSTSSLPYDDIDEVSEVQPLNPRPLTTDDPQDNKPEQNAKEDGATYEVDDPQENYDDIDGDLEPTQTAAEVHEGPRNAPEYSTDAPPDLVLGDDDYLVPGEDG